MTLVETCTPDRRDELRAALGAAFAQDPAVRWFTGDARSTPGRRRAFFRMTVSTAVVALGGCDLTEGGGAVWFPPGAYGSSEHGLLELPLALLAFRGGLARAARADAELRAHHPPAPHWYLSLIGVEPTRAGRGVGSALLAHRLEQVDDRHDAAYLESSLQRNIPLYERFGFEVTGELRVAPDAPPVWPMWRAPR